MTTISSGNVGLARQEGEKSQESQRRSWSARRNEYKFMICSIIIIIMPFHPARRHSQPKRPRTLQFLQFLRRRLVEKTFDVFTAVSIVNGGVSELLGRLSHAEKDDLIRALWTQVQSVTARVAAPEAWLGEPSKTADYSKPAVVAADRWPRFRRDSRRQSAGLCALPGCVDRWRPGAARPVRQG